VPCFEWMCETAGCTERTREWRPKWTPDRPVCSAHGPMERDYHGEARRHIPGAAFPYVTKNITGSPIEVRDQGHLNDLLKAHNLIQRDDAAFVEPMEERFDFGKYNWRTGQWDGRGMKRKEGNGASQKGRWI